MEDVGQALLLRRNGFITHHMRALSETLPEPQTFGRR
jgi:hypothetical protein